MQNVWTRAASARCLCNCSSCSPNAIAVARRTTTSSARRRLGRPDVFTVFSSTLAFSAAMMDSARKEARNRQWDKAIGDARAEVEAAELDQERRLASLVMTADADESTHARRPIQDKHRLITYYDLKHKWRHLLHWAAREERERALAGFDGWRGVPLDTLQGLSSSQLDELLTDKRILQHFYVGDDCSDCMPDVGRWVYSKQKLRTMEWSLLKLVVVLLYKSSVRLKENEPRCARSEAVISRMLSWKRERWKDTLMDTQRRLSMLQDEDAFSNLYETFPSPKAPRFQHSPSEREDELHDLNIKLQAKLHTLTSDTPLDLSATCAHLLILRVAPNIHTYNLLLVRFCQLRKTTLVHAVVESMRESHIRPNEITHATMLRFFAITGDKENFKRYRYQMDGWEQGHSLAHPFREIHPIVRSRYRSLQNGKISVKARMNEDVYTSMIVGSLHLGQRGVAKKYYEIMIREGWQPTMETLQEVLRDCCNSSGDLGSGLEIWKLFRDLHDRGRQVSLKIYDHMMKLCDYAFDIVLKDVQSHEDSLNLAQEILVESLKTESSSVECVDAVHVDEVNSVANSIIESHVQPIGTIIGIEPPALDLWALQRAPAQQNRALDVLPQETETALGGMNSSLKTEPPSTLKGRVKLWMPDLKLEREKPHHSEVVQRAYDVYCEDLGNYREPTRTASSIDVEAWARSDPQLHRGPPTAESAQSTGFVVRYHIRGTKRPIQHVQ